jgi:hypothetical protein
MRPSACCLYVHVAAARLGAAAEPAADTPRAPPLPIAPARPLPFAAAACSKELSKFESAARGAQAVVKYGRLDASAGAGAPEERLLKSMGVDLRALEAAPCALQLVLLPHGTGKEEADEYKR